MSITQKYMKKVNAFDLIYFGGTNIILLCNIYVYKYIPLRNSFCESSSADLLTLQLFLKIHLYFTDAQPQPSHFADAWPKTNSSRSKSFPLRQSNILCSINIFHFFLFRVISAGTFSDHHSFHTQNVIELFFTVFCIGHICYSTYMYTVHLCKVQLNSTDCNQIIENCRMLTLINTFL